MKKLMLGIIAAAVGFGLSGCGDTFKGKSIAQPQVKVFHDRLDAEKYAKIYSTAAADFRKTTTEKKSTEFIEAVHRKLGKVVSTTTISWKVNTHNFKTTVILVQETAFEKGKGTETFTYAISSGEATLLGYNINSTDMMVK